MSKEQSIDDIVNNLYKSRRNRDIEELNELVKEIEWIDKQAKKFGLLKRHKFQIYFWDRIHKFGNLNYGLYDIYEIKNCAYERIVGKYKK